MDLAPGPDIASHAVVGTMTAKHETGFIINMRLEESSGVMTFGNG